MRAKCKHQLNYFDFGPTKNERWGKREKFLWFTTFLVIKNDEYSQLILLFFFLLLFIHYKIKLYTCIKTALWFIKILDVIFIILCDLAQFYIVLWNILFYFRTYIWFSGPKNISFCSSHAELIYTRHSYENGIFYTPLWILVNYIQSTTLYTTILYDIIL